jgi:hypothetical protein
MKKVGQSKIIGLLGVGFDHEDTLVRITQADNYQVLMGSPDSHKALQKICFKINQAVNASGRTLQDYTPKEFMKLVGTLY